MDLEVFMALLSRSRSDGNNAAARAAIDLGAAPSAWSQGLNVLRGRTAVRLSLGLLAVAFVAATGLWIRGTRANHAQEADLSSQLNRYQGQIAAVKAKSGADPATLNAEYATAQAGLYAQTSSMLGSPDQIAAMVAFAGLADRFGVTYGGLSVGGPSTSKLEGIDYGVRSVSMSVHGSQQDMTRFINAIQNGIIPGTSLQHFSLNPGTDGTSASLSMKLYSVSTDQVQFEPPASLSATQGPAAQPGTPELAIGAISTPVLTWAVDGGGSWQDGLISAGFGISAPPDTVQTFQLYAETSGDSSLEPGKDRLLGTAPAPANGAVDFQLKTPFRFSAEQGQRFYLAATVSAKGHTGMLDIGAPPGSMQFLSSAWPDAAHAPDFHVRVPILEPPHAFDLNQSVLAGATDQIHIGQSGQEQGLKFALVTPPQHGVVKGGLPTVTYTPSPGFFGKDQFTYVLTDGALTSGIATVQLEIAKPVDSTSTAP